MDQRVVLLVEDHTENRTIYGDFLRHVGYRVVEAKDGEEGLRLARTARPDVILMDLSLPRIDGWTVTRRLKADRETEHLRVIAITASCLEADHARALEAGCDGYLRKPCLPQEVVDEIERVLG